ncbi:pentapeptide repeat-containing protein [Actinoplanes sp. NPDC020271]|uniref:pentapeptide repeat-containing protein n=1 Tax=Actinoplanes sp. NPDC020271 TaxID=3363896 RepID=UPI0037A99DCA
MTVQRIDPRRRWPWLLSNAGILTVTVIVAGLGITALVVMLLIAGDAPDTERPKLLIEALKYGLGFFAAAGAVAALLVAVRRQLLAENAHDLSERNHQLALQAQAHTETDAAERRVTDLYTKAVEQLGSADAAVRLGGLYALERVAQNNPAQRQTIVSVFCAYLRMPYTPPATTTPAAAGPVTELPLRPAGPTASRDPRQELQVRLTAQRILATHLALPADVTSEQAGTLTPTASQPFWPGLDLDLTGAQLIDWELPRAHLRHADFTSATFSGNARFDKATFSGNARFGEAAFSGDAWFGEAAFSGDAEFVGAAFSSVAGFGEAAFSGDAEFVGAAFSGDAWFAKATFSGDARFNKATFSGLAWFGEATFYGDAWFGKATFSGLARFGEAAFSGDAEFVGAAFSSVAGFGEAAFSGDAEFGEATFSGDAWFDKATFTGDARFNKATFSDDAWFNKTAFSGDARFDKATFTGVAGFGEATFSGVAGFGEATFSGDARFGEATFTGDRLMMTDARAALRGHRQDAWPSGWRIGPGPTDGWCRLVYEASPGISG